MLSLSKHSYGFFSRFYISTFFVRVEKTQADCAPFGAALRQPDLSDGFRVADKRSEDSVYIHVRQGGTLNNAEFCSIFIDSEPCRSAAART